MIHKSETPVDSFYILMRSVPSQMEGRNAERVMVGNRSLLGWKLSSRESDCYYHEFEFDSKSCDSTHSFSPSLTSSSRYFLCNINKRKRKRK